MKVSAYNDGILHNVGQNILFLFLISPFVSDERFKVETKTIVADFEDQTTVYEKIKEGLEGLEIGILGLYLTWFLESLPLCSRENTAKKTDNIIHFLALPIVEMKSETSIACIQKMEKNVLIAQLALSKKAPYGFYTILKPFVCIESPSLSISYTDNSPVFSSS